MKLLAVTDNLANVGGAELSAQTTISELSHRSDISEVTVIGVNSSSESNLDFGDAHVVPVNIPERVERLPALAADLIIKKLLAREIEAQSKSADLIHAHHRRSALALSGIETSAKTIATVRDYWPVCPISTYSVAGERCTGCEDRLDDCVTRNDLDGHSRTGTKAYLLAKRRHQRQVLSSIDCSVFIANHLRDRMSNSMELPPHTTVVYNPVSMDTDIESVSLPFPTFVTASSLTRSKGIETAIKAVGRLADRYPNCRLIVFGDGPDYERLDQVAETHAPNSIEFRGRVPTSNVYRTMAGATATIFPSLWEEPFGRITVESMMLGTPVIGSDVGGIAEIIEDGANGLLFPPGDSSNLAAKLRRITEEGDLRRKLSSKGRLHSRRFRPERIADDHISAYSGIL
ncbi:glycosyltransferase family 4 protein [Halorubrum sp. HHNYT27]|uniref:glycosyltransferase family 4 protein n=1 Tax=Halorubrum sp. HHNYT27 TaxID=3402275 RepID=UPI003EBBBBD8